VQIVEKVRAAALAAEEQDLVAVLRCEAGGGKRTGLVFWQPRVLAG